MKKIEVPKVKKKKVLSNKKKLSLGFLKKKARLSLESGQKDVYEKRMIKKNWSLARVYRVGFWYGKSLSPPAPKKMAKSVLCAALIYKGYGVQVFDDFLAELKENNKT